jgi:drug/metabolite transporter (DMT)-like permease
MVDICGIRLSQIVLADLQILAAAFCFGIGFIGMREISVEGLGPMTANSVRFGLSTVLLMIFKPWVPEDKGEAGPIEPVGLSARLGVGSPSRPEEKSRPQRNLGIGGGNLGISGGNLGIGVPNSQGTGTRNSRSVPAR